MAKRLTANIPTDAEFEAASKAMTTRLRNEAELKKRATEICSASPSFHDIWIALPEGQCHAKLFVLSDADIESPAAMLLRDAVSDLLRGMVGPLRKVTVDLDSHERVLREFNGNYALCMR